MYWHRDDDDKAHFSTQTARVVVTVTTPHCVSSTEYKHEYTHSRVEQAKSASTEAAAAGLDSRELPAITKRKLQSARAVVVELDV